MSPHARNPNFIPLTSKSIDGLPCSGTGLATILCTWFLLRTRDGSSPNCIQKPRCERGGLVDIATPISIILPFSLRV